MTHAQNVLEGLFSKHVPTGACAPDAICDLGGPENAICDVGHCDRPIAIATMGVEGAVESPTFDLTKIRDRVRDNNPKLSEDVLELGELRYRKFLAEAKMNPNSRTSPDLLVDEFWHAHILFTKKYDADCASYFGYFLHHDPR